MYVQFRWCALCDMWIIVWFMLVHDCKLKLTTQIECAFFFFLLRKCHFMNVFQEVFLSVICTDTKFQFFCLLWDYKRMLNAKFMTSLIAQ